MTRRGALLTLAASTGFAQSSGSKLVLYSALGTELTAWDVDVKSASLARKASVTLPQNVQEAWPHPSRRYLYVAWSNNVRGAAGRHGVTAFRIDRSTGALEENGRPIPVPARSVFITVDIPGENLIAASNDPSGATVHRIESDGTLGAAVNQPANLDFGVYAHQVRIHPSNQMVIVVTRGNGPTAKKPEDPGAIKVFGYSKGVLSNRASIAPDRGFNFQPRHIDFHPTLPFAFVTLERQNKLQAYRVVDGPSLSAAPLFTRDTLTDPAHIADQATSAIHVHPNGRFVYLGNRGSRTVEFKGQRVLAGAENSIAVYSVNQKTGEPKLIQNADTHGVHPRTFTMDPSGRMLVVANMQDALVRDKDAARPVPATLSVFRIGSDGKLAFMKNYDQETNGRSLFWTGMIGLP